MKFPYFLSNISLKPNLQKQLRCLDYLRVLLEFVPSTALRLQLPSPAVPLERTSEVVVPGYHRRRTHDGHYLRERAGFAPLCLVVNLILSNNGSVLVTVLPLPQVGRIKDLEFQVGRIAISETRPWVRIHRQMLLKGFAQSCQSVYLICQERR